MSILPWGDQGDPEEITNPNDQLAVEDVTVATPDIDLDEQTIAEDVFDQLADRIPGWTAADGNLDVWLVEAFAAIAAELRQLVASIPDAIFVAFGTEVLGIPIMLPTSALGESTWTAVDAQGYSIQVGTQFTLARTGSDLVAFEVVAGADIPPGDTTIEGVQIRAIEDGVQGNGLSGIGELIDPLNWVDDITVPNPTTGGTDGQTTQTYLEMLVALLRQVALRPILPLDLAVLALFHNPEVGRAIAMDLYDPATQTWGHERTITLILTGHDGLPVSGPVKDDVRAYLESLREVNFIVNVIDADYQTVDVTYEVTAFAEQNPAFVQEACDLALTDALSPQYYRLGTTSPSILGGEVIPPPAQGQQPGRRFVRINDLIGLLDRTRGVDWVMSVDVDGDGDVELGSPTTLPKPGVIQGTVHAQ